MVQVWCIFLPICIVIDASPAAITNQAIFKTMSSSLTNHDMFLFDICVLSLTGDYELLVLTF